VGAPKTSGEKNIGKRGKKKPTEGGSKTCEPQGQKNAGRPRLIGDLDEVHSSGTRDSVRSYWGGEKDLLLEKGVKVKGRSTTNKQSKVH